MDIYKGKICIVTGAASGIGKALTEELSQREARIIAADINVDGLQKALMSLKNVTLEKLDVTDYDAFKKIVDDTVSREGRLDYIFNNAGIGVGGEVRDQDIEHWRKVLDVNLNGTIYGSVLAYKIMVKQGFGHIVNTSSLEGLVPFPETVPYVTTKFGVVGLSHGMYVEAADLGVKVSVVCPGFIRTPIFDNSVIVSIDRERMMEKTTFGLLLKYFGVSAEDCARVILKGVARNRSIIIVTPLARVMWWLARISPIFVMNLTRRDFRRWRNKVRIATQNM